MFHQMKSHLPRNTAICISYGRKAISSVTRHLKYEFPNFVLFMNGCFISLMTENCSRNELNSTLNLLLDPFYYQIKKLKDIKNHTYFKNKYTLIY